MSNNFLISLRNDAGLGIPGTKIGQPAYMSIQEKEELYDLRLRMDSRVWLESIRRSGASSVLVFVHGFADDARKAVARHNSIKPHLPTNIALVSFDWPAGNLDKPYETDKANAKQIAPQLVRDCLQLLLGGFDSGNVNLFAHSMGAYVTETAFFNVPNASTMKINHVLMAAADVDQSNYGRESTSLKNFLGNCTDLTAYWSTDDAALQKSVTEEINKGAVPLGLKGYPDPDVPLGCQSIQCTTYYNRYVKYSGQDVTFSHIWYILYPVTPPQPPAVNDFYTDMIKTLQAPPVPVPPPPSPTRAVGFMLRRPI